MKRIICIGNRYDERGAAGPRVHDRLAREALPADVELIDGGPAGLDLLGYVAGAERIVFVDAAPEEHGQRDVMIWTGDRAEERAVRVGGDASGLARLLSAESRTGSQDAPVIWAVSVCGAPLPGKIVAAARWALHLARTGRAIRLWRIKELAATA